MSEAATSGIASLTSTLITAVLGAAIVYILLALILKRVIRNPTTRDTVHYLASVVAIGAIFFAAFKTL